MLKKILKLEGTTQISKKDQREIKAGLFVPDDCFCVFTGPQGFLVLEDISCDARAECESRPNGRFFGGIGF